MRTCGAFAVITSMCWGLLNFLFGCYPAIENFSPDPNDSVQIQKITKNNQFTPSELSNKIETYLNRLEKSGFSGAVLVAQNNKIIFEKGYGIDTGRVLGSNILKNDFSELPDYGRSQIKS